MVSMSRSTSFSAIPGKITSEDQQKVVSMESSVDLTSAQEHFKEQNLAN